MRGTALVFPVFVLYVVTIGRVSMTATDAALIALGERFEKLLLEHMDAWLEWAPRMRAAHAEVRDNMAALAVAIQRTGCDVAQARMSELERDMQLLAEEIIAAPATSLAGLRAPLGGTSGQLLPRLCVRFSGRIMLAVRCGRRDDRPHADGARARGQARGRCGVQGWWRVASRRCAFKAAGFVPMKRLKRKPMSRTFTAIAALRR